MLAEQGQKQPEFRVNHVIITCTDLTNGLYWAGIVPRQVNRTINQGVWLIRGSHPELWTKDIATWQVLSNYCLMSCDLARGSLSRIVTKIALLAHRQFYKYAERLEIQQTHWYGCSKIGSRMCLEIKRKIKSEKPVKLFTIATQI